ncbi:MAG: phosphoribosylamine--glycine ligase [Actinomycetota bacterium]|nr:phosphoribosylamine--glycine ligase [Actinomycetota bacterium]
MKVLVVGSGAREHALARALSRDPQVTRLVVAPGNAGTADAAETLQLDPMDPEAVASAAAGFDLVVVGPEAPLVAGVADAVRAVGIPVFGPSAAAAQLEGSKSFAKDVMAKAGVPTAAADTCETGAQVVAALGSRRPPYVVKADGLAAGKGVLVTDDRLSAETFARDVLSTAGARVVIEDYLDGPEVSLFAITDGTTVVPLLPAQDHKRVGDDETGPNTGGMGAYAPLPWLASSTIAEVQERVLQPVVDEMARRGSPFSGLLYAGLAMTSRGPQVVEFNCRFGDPETQVVLALLETPLAGLLLAASTGELATHPALRWHPGAAVTVVIAAEGYPGTPVAGDTITVGDLPEGVDVLHAGTRALDGQVVSSGGRVLSVTATGLSLSEARERAYQGVAAVEMRGGFSRSDIAARAVRGEITVPDQTTP